MAPVTGNGQTAQKRRVPTQARSRERVERILDAASKIVVSEGVDGLTTRSIAAAAGMPVASIYQYFSDRDAILLAIVERDTAEMDEQVAADLGELEVWSIESLVRTTMTAYVKVYHRRPAFVEIWLRGRTNQAVHDYGRLHNRRTATSLFSLAEGLGLITPGTEPMVAELAVEIGDRIFQLAFEKDDRGEEAVVAEGIAMVGAYLKGYATDAGIDGVRP